MNLLAGPTGDAAWRARERARRLRAFALQGTFALVLVLLVVLLAQNVGANLAARQIKSGFGFLQDPAGFNIGEALFDYSARDSYLRAFAVGLANTVRVSLAGIVLASFLGVNEDTGKLLGLDKEWAYRIVKEVGNYGESFERNLGPKSPVGLPRGVNNLWNKGGLMYAPPIR